MPSATTVLRKPKTDARAAANAAAAYFKGLYPTVRSFSLEEVELSDDGTHWLITLSFDIAPSSTVALPFQPPRTRYKVFTVDAKTGEVLKMKIRKLE